MKKTFIFLASSCFFCSIFFFGCSSSPKSQNTMVIADYQAASDTLPEVGFGSFCVYPSDRDGTAVPCGTNELCLFFQRENITPYKGYVHIYNASDGTLFDSIDVMDPERCLISPLDSFGSHYSGWDSGTQVILYSDRFFESGCNYYIVMEEGNFVTSPEDGSFLSHRMNGENILRFSSLSYGIIPKGNSMVNEFVTGDISELTICLGAGAASAAVTDYDSSILWLSETYFDTDYQLSMEFLSAGKSSLTIEFYDTDGYIIDSITYHFSVLL